MNTARSGLSDGSVRSRASSAGRYRTTARSSEVDESLFGDSTAKKKRSQSAGRVRSENDQGGNGSLGSARSEMSQGSAGSFGRRGIASAGRVRPTMVRRDELAPTAVVVGRAELNRIKASTVIRTNAEIRAEREEMLRQRDIAKAESKRRKDRMKELGAKALQQQNMTAEDIERDIQRKALLAAASKKRNENNDGVKLLNTYGARAAAFTLRQDQIVQKRQTELKEMEYDRRMCAVMELERLKDLERREAVEAVKVKKRHDDREVLMQQIEERKQQRQREQEQTRLEGEKMKEQIEAARLEELARQQQKAEIAAQKRIEIARENDKAIERKKDVLREELEADLEVVRYNEKKAEMDRQREEAEFAAEAEKNRLQKKMLDSQEKAQEERGEMDELRGKRHQEELERKVRAREEAEAAKRAEQQRLMGQARIDQMAAKDAARAQEIARQKHEYVEAQRAATAMQEREDAEQRVWMEKRAAHRASLDQQVFDKHANDGDEAEQKRLDGLHLRQDFANELAVLEKTRKEIIAEFRKQGVDERFMSEMVRADMRKFQMRC